MLCKPLELQVFENKKIASILGPDKIDRNKGTMAKKVEVEGFPLQEQNWTLLNKKL